MSGDLLSTTNALGQVIRYDSYDAHGRPSETFDLNNVLTSVTYSRLGQILSQTFDPGGLALTSTTQYVDNLLHHHVSPKGMVTVQSYDSYRRVSSIGRRAVVSGSDLELAVYQYNFDGLRTLEAFHAGDANTPATFSISSSQGRSLDPGDNEMRQYVRTETPSGSGNWATTWSDALGRPRTRQDPSGHLTRYEYDTKGRLSTVTERDVSDGTMGLVDHVTLYGYDDADNLTSVTDPMGLVTNYKYDDFGRLLEVASPDSGTTHSGYDLAGRLISKTQGVGTTDEATTTYVYDNLGRLLGVAYATEGRDVDYYYDGKDLGGGTSIPCNGYSVPIPQPDSVGRLSAIALRLDETTNDKIVTTYEYDKRGLLLFERKYVLSATPHVTSYTYDADANIETVSYPRGLLVDYVYDGPDADRVTIVQADRGGGPFDVATGIEYYPFGDVQTLAFGNGRSLTLDMDQAYRLATIDVPGVVHRGFGRDTRGNIFSVGYTISTTDKTFGYDQVSRLTSASGPFGSYSYRFDKNGNRLEVNEGSVTTYQYYAGTNRISGLNGGPALRFYNGFGNVISHQPDLFLSYGPDDRLLSHRAAFVDDPGQSFLHLPDGRRLQKTANEPFGEPHRVVYHYDLAGNLISETYVTDPSGNENPSLEYVYLGQHRLAAITSQGPSGSYVPLIALGPIPTDGTWYAKLIHPDALKTALWMMLGLSGVLMSVGLYRRSPRLAGTTGLMLLAGGGTVLWIGSTPKADAIAVPSCVYFFHNGHLGEPLALTNNAGSVVWLSDYKPYGQLYGESGSVTIGDPGTTGIVWKPAFRFPGQLQDNETALFYNHHRYYQPGLGNYTRPDLIAPSETKTIYSYALSNPVSFADPLGLFAFDEACVGPCMFQLPGGLTRQVGKYAGGNEVEAFWNLVTFQAWCPPGKRPTKVTLGYSGLQPGNYLSMSPQVVAARYEDNVLTVKFSIQSRFFFGRTIVAARNMLSMLEMCYSCTDGNKMPQDCSCDFPPNTDRNLWKRFGYGFKFPSGTCPMPRPAFPPPDFLDTW